MVDKGALAEARAFVDRTGPRPRLGDGSRLYDAARVRLLLAEGRYADALHLLDQRPEAAYRTANPAWFEERSLRAQALAGLGDTATALALAQEDHVQQRRWGAPSLVGRTLRLVGQLRGGPEGLAELREATALLAPTGVRLEYARAVAALATAVPEDEERIDLLSRALRLAEECGADGLRAAVAADLAACGVPVPGQPDVAGTLTTTERRIAAMAADGADDREIAQALFLTPRSVADALASVRDRLGVHSHTELRQALGVT
jgi:DNA-binding CsgD family transcriptional regulator